MSQPVPNIEPGYGDGTLTVETDGISVGYGLSAFYELGERTQLGFNYHSEIEPSLDGKAKFKNLGPITEEILDRAGLLNATIDVTSRSPRSVTSASMMRPVRLLSVALYGPRGCNGCQKAR